MRPCLDTVNIDSRRLEEIGQWPELTALEGGKLPGTAVEVSSQRLNEIRKLKFNVAMKERKTKKEGKKERSDGKARIDPAAYSA